ncbi:MAG: sigma-70 family polymerase sigma factor [Fibrobacteres bacterium]|nr:sigma-70 family polymerase sigma factor [Fibrobacterota bacterium]
MIDGPGERDAGKGPPPGGAPLAAHFFRHESGRLVALLTRILGTENLEIAEDAVQETLIQAMETWKLAGPPENPPAWLFRVAKNKAIDVIRRQRHSVRFDFSDGDRILLNSEYTLATTMETLWNKSSIEDDMLGMMFACCHPGLNGESQISLVLKTLCGFSTAEIAQAFLASEDTVSKRLFRAKEFFRKERIRPGIPPDAELKERLGVVLNSVYLLFNEGYRSTHDENPIRTDLMGEALLLGRLLAENPHTAEPRVFALMALMCFHASRSDSRVTSEGGLVLLPQQDRGLWDERLITEGCAYLDRASTGEAMTSYHLEAAIAYEHCRAESFAATDWARILHYYQWLCRIAPGPMAELNRIIVVMQVSGPAEALRELEGLSDMKGDPKGMQGRCLYHSLLGEIHARLGDSERARAGFETAAGLTQNEAERKVLRDKAERLGR